MVTELPHSSDLGSHLTQSSFYSLTNTVGTGIPTFQFSLFLLLPSNSIQCYQISFLKYYFNYITSPFKTLQGPLIPKNFINRLLYSHPTISLMENILLPCLGTTAQSELLSVIFFNQS